MRKNGVIRGITKIDGGICSPKGFTACGSEKDSFGWEYALIKSEDRLPAAFACTESGYKSSCLRFAEKRFNGILRVFAVLSGVPDTGDGNGAAIAKDLCVCAGRTLGVPDQDVLPFIVGDASRRLQSPNIKELLRGAIPRVDNSAAAARAICGNGINKEGAFSFFVGDTLCKFGFIGRGSTFSAPDCLLALLTTDTDISSVLLKKALDAEMKDSFGMLCLSDLPSPCDAVAVMANGRAGNFPITQPDTDYHKFAEAFHLACWEICKILARRKGTERIFTVQVKGAKSKQSAREIAKALVKSAPIKNSLTSCRNSAGSILCSVGQAASDCPSAKISAYIVTEKEKVQMMDEGKATAFSVKKFKDLVKANEITLLLELKNGNYSASALTTLEEIR